MPHQRKVEKEFALRTKWLRNVAFGRLISAAEGNQRKRMKAKFAFQDRLHLPWDLLDVFAHGT